MHTYLKAKINIRLEQKNANRLPIMDEFSRKSRLIKLLCMVAFLKMHDRTMQMGKKYQYKLHGMSHAVLQKYILKCQFALKNIHVFVIFLSSKKNCTLESNNMFDQLHANFLLLLFPKDFFFFFLRL